MKKTCDEYVVINMAKILIMSLLVRKNKVKKTAFLSKYSTIFFRSQGYSTI